MRHKPVAACEHFARNLRVAAFVGVEERAHTEEREPRHENGGGNP